MMKVVAIAFACCALTGCAAKVVSSSPRTVVIAAPDAAVAEAQTLADAECRKYDRPHARLLRSPSPTSNQFVYDCVH